MSETAPSTPDPVPPKKRRRWVIAVLIALLACGGTAWWRNRLTPDERVFVGVWQQFEMPENVLFGKVELRSNRTGSSMGGECCWAADQGRIVGREDRSIYVIVLEWVRSGFKNWRPNKPDYVRYEIIDPDTIRLTSLDGSPGDQPRHVFEWRRVKAK